MADLPRSSSRQAQAILLGLLGFLVGYLGLRFATGATPTSRMFADTPRYQVWALVVGAGTAYVGFIALPLWDWNAAIRRRFVDGRGQRRAMVVALCWSASIAAPLAFQSLTGPKVIRSPVDHYTVRMAVLLLINLVAIFPAVLDFQLVQQAAGRMTGADGDTDEAGQMSDHLFLQSMLRGLLAVLGGLVTVAVLELGALINAINAFRPGEEVPSEIIFVAASLFAAGLAVLYLPAFSALQHAGQHLVDMLSPLPSVGDDAFVVACDKRDRLRSMLGIDTSAKANLESGVLTLTPLIGGAVTTFVRV